MDIQTTLRLPAPEFTSGGNCGRAGWPPMGILGNGAFGTGPMLLVWPEGKKEEYSGGGELSGPISSSHCPLPLIFYKRQGAVTAC